jgi:hypothetical protein
MMSDRERAKLDHQARAVRQLARGLPLIALTPILLTFTLPIATLELPDTEPAPLTLRALVGEFGSMRSAFGVRPVVLLLIAALITLFVGCCVVAAGTVVEDRWAVAINSAAVIVIVAALLLAPLLGSADHVANEGSSNPPFEVHAQGWAFALLASGLSIATLRMKREVEDDL